MRNLREFWCELFGHEYKFQDYIYTKREKRDGIVIYFPPTKCEWTCRRCGKKVRTSGEIAKNNPPKDGNIWL